ncbi:MAG: tetratricopeptide repeat protein [Planctomycetes bacterium]|nr:tetratricopeptide repeat protein [Planctomycetota bacterium]
MRPDLGGKKVKCKACGVVLRIPEVPLDESAEAPPAPAPPPKAKEPAPPPGDVADYEVVKEGELQLSCPTCGAHCAPSDSACLACGAELGGEGAAGLLARVPRPVLFAALGVIGFGLLGLFGHSLWKASRPASYTRDGFSLLNAGDAAAAQAAFKEALAFDPQYAEAHLGLAEVGAKTRDPLLLERHGQRGIAAATDAHQRARLRLALARVKVDAGDYKSARNQAVDAKDDDPDLAPMARGIIGLSAVLAGQEEEALAELRFAAAQRVDEPRIYRELAELLMKRSEWVEARTNAEQCAKLVDDDPKLWLTLAELRQLTADQPGAKVALVRVIELDEQSAQAHSRLSAILLAEGALDAALEASERACKLAPEDLESRLAMGRILLALDRPKAAQEELEKALKVGSSWEAEFLLGRALLATGDAQGGARRMTSALDKRQDDLPLHREAARLAIEANAGAAAAAILQRIISRHDRDYDVHLLMARALAGQDGGRVRNDAQIQDHLRRCIDIDPARRDAPAVLGAHLLEKLESDAAIEVLDRALERNAQDKELLFLKGRACIRAKRWDQAIRALEALRVVDAAYPELDQWLRRAHEGKFYGE